jgi:thiol-disulfide isomerase/thioredoxin
MKQTPILLIFSFMIFLSSGICQENNDIKDKRPAMQLKDKPLPAFSGESISGVMWDNEKLKGNVVLLNFWYIGCPPCMQEIPLLNGLYNEYKNNDDFILLSVAPQVKEDLLQFSEATDSFLDEVREMYGFKRIEYEIIAACPERLESRMKIEDSDTTYIIRVECDSIVKDFMIKGYPTTFIIDKQGVIRHVKIGLSVNLLSHEITSEEEVETDTGTTIVKRGNISFSADDKSESIKMINVYKEIIDRLLKE